MRSVRGVLVAVAVAVGVLVGCGGGGGGAGADAPPVGGGGFELTPSTLEFTHVRGDTAPDAQVMHATWTAADGYYLGVAVRQGSALPAWLPAPTIRRSARSGDVTLRVLVDGLAPGVYSASFMVGIARADETPIGYRDATVTLVVHAARQPPAPGTQLRVGAEGVALTRTPGLTLLSRTLPVGTNGGGPGVAWTAVSSRAWLHATAAGAAGDPLALTADPEGLASDAVHEAVVTVASADPRLAVSTQTVRVGLWVGAHGPEAVTTVTAAYRDLAVDPVRPYVYLVDDTATIAIRNVHTGAAVGTIVVPGSAVLRSPTVAADGTRLYAVDVAGHVATVVDLAALTPVGSWPLPAPYDRIVWTRIDGFAALLSTSSQVYVPDTGAPLGRLPWTGSSSASLAVSRDGTRVCAADLGISPYYTRCAALDAGTNALGPAVLAGPAQSRWNVNAGYGAYLALAPDGARLFEAPEARQLTACDATSAALATVPFAGPTPTYLYAVTAGPDGRVYAGGAASGGAGMLWAWDAAGTLIWSREAGAAVRGRLALSGDGLRLVALTGANTYTATAVEIVTLP